MMMRPGNEEGEESFTCFLRVFSYPFLWHSHNAALVSDWEYSVGGIKTQFHTSLTKHIFPSLSPSTFHNVLYGLVSLISYAAINSSQRSCYSNPFRFLPFPPAFPENIPPPLFLLDPSLCYYPPSLCQETYLFLINVVCFLYFRHKNTTSYKTFFLSSSP